MNDVFRELSHRDKGAAKALKEKLDDLKRAKALLLAAAVVHPAERAQVHQAKMLPGVDQHIKNALVAQQQGHLPAMLPDVEHFLRECLTQQTRYLQGLHRNCSLLIFSCNLIKPSKSASGRGGQPGTYTSTGTI